MPDVYAPLPEDDESVDVLTSEFDDYMRDAVPGWEPSDGAIEVAMRAAFADEASTLYSLVRERGDDEFRDFGADILGILPAEATPATASTTWTARDTLGPYTIEAGYVIVVDAPEGRFAFEVVEETTLAVGQSVAAGVLVQALEAGTDANGINGPVVFDEQPAWVDTVVLAAAASGGTDAEEDDDYLDRVARASQLLSRAPILPADYELAAQEIAGVTRALVRDGYDNNNGTSNNQRTVSIYPAGPDGLAVSAPTLAAVQALIQGRREVNWIVRVANPTYTTINVNITVSANEGYDEATVQAAVTAAIAQGPLNPALWGQPQRGDVQKWLLRTVVRRYEIAAAADLASDVYDVVDVTMAISPAAPSAQDIVLTGPAPLPLAGTITVTVVAPT